MNKHRYVRLFLASTFFALMGMVTMGCKNNNNIPKMYSVTIGAHTNGTLTATVKGSTRTIQSGDQVTKGTVIVFTAKANTGYVFDKWIGALSGTTTPAELTVEKNVTVGAIFKSPPDNNSQSSNNSNNNNGGSSGGGNGSGSGNGGSNGGGGETNPGTGSEQGAAQTYSVTIEKPEHGTLSAKIGDSDITAPKKQEGIKKGTKVTFIAEPAANFKIKKWIGLPEGADQTNPAQQTVTLDKDLTVKVEFELEPVPEGNIRIIYDAEKIHCTQGSLSLPTHSAVAENTQLTFAAVSSMTEIDHWFVNNMEKSSDKRFSYTVTAADATDRTITVSYKEKEKPVISFDSSKVTVKIHAAYPGDTKINPRDKISYGTALHFTVQPSQGMIVDQWMINSVDKTSKFNPYGNNIYTYTVDISDVQNGKLDITFTEKPKVSKKITFDASQIEVYKRYDSTRTKIVTETEVTEGDELAFRATLALGTIVDEWKINGRKIGENRSYVFNHIVKDADFSEQGMELKITTKNSVQGKLELGDKVTCKKGVNPITNETDSIQTGDDIQETDVLYLESSETGTGYWKINGKREHGIGPGLPFVVEAKYFVGGKMKIEFVKNTNG